MTGTILFVSEHEQPATDTAHIQDSIDIGPGSNESEECTSVLEADKNDLESIVNIDEKGPEVKKSDVSVS